MIKIDKYNLSAEVKQKVEKAKESLAHEQLLKSGKYNTEAVNEALAYVFHKKCYLCENKKVTSYEIEHLRPYRGDSTKQFDWDNLYLSCSHCNNTKSDRYEHVLDCSQEEVDQLISFRRLGSYVHNEKIEIQALSKRDDVKETVELLNKIYNGTTPQKKLESVNLRCILRDELIKFEQLINAYEESIGEDKIDAQYHIEHELKPNSPFAAFKRWIVKDNIEYLSTIHSIYIP